MALTDAWQAYEAGDFAAAEAGAYALLTLSHAAKERCAVLNALGFVFTAQKRFDEGRQVFLDLFNQTASHHLLHNLIMLEREAGRFQAALELVQQERRLLPDDDLAWAANLYEEALLLNHMGATERSLSAARACLRRSAASVDLMMQVVLGVC